MKFLNGIMSYRYYPLSQRISPLSNRIDDANRLFDAAIEIAKTVDLPSSRAFSLCSIAQDLAKSRMFKKAIETANRAYMYDKADALSTIAENLAESKMFEEAIQISDY